MVLFESVWIHHGCCSKARSEESNPFAWRTGKSRVEREQPLLVNVGWCWSLLVAVGCVVSLFAFTISAVQAWENSNPCAIGHLWTILGSRWFEMCWNHQCTGNERIWGNFEEIRGPRKRYWYYLVLGGFSVFVFFGWPAGSPRCIATPKNLRCLAYVRLPSCPIISSMDPPVDLRRTDDPNWIPLQATPNRWRTHGLNGLASSDRKWETTDINRSLPCGFSMWNPFFCQIGRKARLWPKIRTAKARETRVVDTKHASWLGLTGSQWFTVGHSGHRFHSPLSCGISWDVWVSKSNRTGLRRYSSIRGSCSAVRTSFRNRNGQAWCVVRLPVVEPSCWLRRFFCGPSALTFPMLFP